MPERAVSHTTPVAGGGLDSGSELSELTEEEQDGDARSNDDDDPDDAENDAEDRLEGNRRRPTRGSGRRKRGGMVPAPMWDWAYKQKKNADRNGEATQQGEVEEEEEEPTPAERMEEEEDDDDEQASRQASARLINRKNGAGEHDNQEAHADWGESIDEVDPSFYDALSPGTQSKRTSANRRIDSFSRGTTNHIRHSTSAVNINGDENETDDDDEEVDEEEEADVEEEDGDVPQLSLDADADADLGVESEGESEADADAAPDETPALKSKSLGPMDIDEPVDVTAPSPSTIAPMVALAAQASIMAGSSILASPTPSSNSSLSGSPTSSRSASPTPEKNSEGTTVAHVHSPKRLGKGKPESSSNSQLVVGPAPAVPKDKLSVLPKVGHAEPEGENETASVAPDELDLEMEVEMDADMQPAHRAEALDVLASIELKFALLRERVYVEKMESIAWEETLIAEGAHLFSATIICCVCTLLMHFYIACWPTICFYDDRHTSGKRIFAQRTIA